MLHIHPNARTTPATRAEIARSTEPSGTVARLERGENLKDLKDSTLATIRAALEAAGVELIDQDGGGPGVRQRASEAD